MVRDIIFAFICTVLAGFFAASTLGTVLNWPDAGAVFSVAVMGCFILRAVYQKRGAEDASDEET